MIDVQWGDFILRAEGSAAVLLLAIPLMSTIQIPVIQKIIHALARKARSGGLVADISYRIRQLEKK